MTLTPLGNRGPREPAQEPTPTSCTSSARLAPPTRAAFVFVFITVALDMLALGVMIPVLPKRIIEFEGGNVTG